MVISLCAGCPLSPSLMARVPAASGRPVTLARRPLARDAQRDREQYAETRCLTAILRTSSSGSAASCGCMAQTRPRPQQQQPLLSATSPEPAPEPAPKHRMCRAVRTVEDLWREWTVGLQGGPSIAQLDRRWGNRWRAGRQSELQWYSMRLEAIKEIRRVAQARRTSEEAAMWQVSHHHQQQRCSLDQFCKQLRAARKEGKR